MRRRDFLGASALVPMVPRTANGAPDRQPLGLVVHSFWIRRQRPLDPDFSSIAEPFDLLAAAARVGAAGIQTPVGTLNEEMAARLRDSISSRGMYLEGIVALPKTLADVDRFQRELVTSRAAGASILRTVCLNGRRYEEFKSAGQFREFMTRSWESLRLAEPIAARIGVRLAVENHKDWRLEEMLDWLRKLDSPHVGVCLDTGNNMALLDEPMAVVRGLAPWTLTTHFKDMGIAECEDGFLLSEVPLGDGLLDLAGMVAELRKVNPRVKLNLEMITRDPLRIPCLAPHYWTTMADTPASALAGMLDLVRQRKGTPPLPTVSSLAHAEQLMQEAANIAKCLAFARERLA